MLMNFDLYSYTLVVAIAVLATLSLTLFCFRINGGDEFRPYRSAKNSFAMVFSIIAVDFASSLALNHSDLSETKWDTIVDVLCYTPVAACFAWGVSVLLENESHTRERLQRDALIWAATLITAVASLLLGDSSAADIIFSIVIGVWAVFVRSYRHTMRMMDNYYSDDIYKEVRWLRYAILSFVAWGILSPIASVLGTFANAIYTAAGIGLFIFLGISFINYRHGYGLVIRAPQTDASASAAAEDPEAVAKAEYRMESWEQRNGHRKSGLTIEQLAAELDVDCTTLSRAINRKYSCSFRDRVNRLRVRDAQEQLVRLPHASVDEIAKMVGYTSESELNIHFRRTLGVMPTDWREGVTRLMQ